MSKNEVIDRYMPNTMKNFEIQLLSSRSNHRSLCGIDLLWGQFGWISCNKSLKIMLGTENKAHLN